MLLINLVIILSITHNFQVLIDRFFELFSIFTKFLIIVPVIMLSLRLFIVTMSYRFLNFELVISNTAHEILPWQFFCIKIVDIIWVLVINILIGLFYVYDLLILLYLQAWHILITRLVKRTMGCPTKHVCRWIVSFYFRMKPVHWRARYMVVFRRGLSANLSEWDAWRRLFEVIVWNIVWFCSTFKIS